MLKIFTSGAFVNFILVIVGSGIGMLLKCGIPEKIQKTLVSAVALCVLYIGITGLFEENINPLILIISTALGAVIGQAIDLDRLVNKLAEKIENKFKKGDSQSGIVAEGFVSAILLFCVGAIVAAKLFGYSASLGKTSYLSHNVNIVVTVAVTCSKVTLAHTQEQIFTLCCDFHCVRSWHLSFLLKLYIIYFTINTLQIQVYY